MSATLFLVPLALAGAGAIDPVADAALPAAMEPPAAEAQPLPIEHAGAAPQPLEATELDSLRGGQTLVVGNQSLTAVNTGNVLNGDYVAGSVTLSDNAFANFNGLGNLAINTGAQVSLQSGMNVVINIAP